jgi:hypothetical protein
MFRAQLVDRSLCTVRARVARALHSAANIMKINSLPFTFLLALGATAAGCASTAPVDDDDDGGGDGSGDGSGSETIPLTAEGTYALTSDFDIATNMPGTAGDVINAFIAATDGADDPTHWILEQLVAQLPDGSFKNTVQGAIPFVSGYLNDRLLEVAPGFVTTLVDMGDKFGQVARHFGTVETLAVGANGEAVHTINGVHFKVDELELTYLFKDYNMQDVTVAGVLVSLEKTGRLTVADHKVPLSYGKVLRIAIDEMIIPIINPSAVTIEDVLKDVVNCEAVGRYTYEALGIGSASTFETACLGGLKAGSNAIYTQIAKIDDAALEFGINGIAKGIDKNKDGKMDQIQTGAWAGTLAYGGSDAPLGSATFFGTRMD